jgi:hypothetical protein
MYNMILYLCVLIVFLLHRESLKLILAMNPSLRWFCHNIISEPTAIVVLIQRPFSANGAATPYFGILSHVSC